jgi:hypothetical protein
MAVAAVSVPEKSFLYLAAVLAPRLIPPRAAGLNMFNLAVSFRTQYLASELAPRYHRQTGGAI